MRLGQIVEKNLVNALFRPEIIRVLLPQAPGFRAIDKISKFKSVGRSVQSLDEAALIKFLSPLVLRFSCEGISAQHVACDNEKETCKALIPKLAVNINNACGVIL